MTKSQSLYLNFLRIVAAAVVFLGHLFGSLPPASRIWKAVQFLNFGHDGVIVFFVLSGYVVAYASAERETSGTAYAIARFTRISSVLIPALILSFIVNALLCAAYPHNSHFPWKPWDPLIALTMLTQSGTFGYDLPYDGPFWSLDYEIWYYVAFGLAMFAPGQLLKIVGAGLALLVAGPKIAILAPVWLLGVAAYRLQKRFILRKKIALAVFTITILIYLALKPFDPYYLAAIHLTSPIEQHTHFLFYASNGFEWDWFLGILMALNIFAFRSLTLPDSFLGSLAAKSIAAAAGVTYSVYLYHAPLILLMWALLNPAISQHLHVLISGVFALSVSVLLASITEHQRWRITALIRLLLKPNQTVSNASQAGSPMASRGLPPAIRSKVDT